MKFNGAGDRLATVAADERVRVFAVPGKSDGKPLYAPLPDVRLQLDHTGMMPAFIDSDRGLLTASGHNELTWWDANSGKPIRRIPDETYGLTRVEASAGGRYFALCGYRGAQFWDAANVKPGWLLKHRNHVQGAAFDPTGSLLVTAGADRIVQLCSTFGAELRYPPLVHQDAVMRAAFDFTGKVVATAQEDGLVRVWKLRQDSCDWRVPLVWVKDHLALSRDGKYVLNTGQECGSHAMRVYQTADGRPAGVIIPVGTLPNSWVFSPDGRHVLILASAIKTLDERHWRRYRPHLQPGRTLCREWRTGKEVFTLPTPSEPVGASARMGSVSSLLAPAARFFSSIPRVGGSASAGNTGSTSARRCPSTTLCASLPTAKVSSPGEAMISPMSGMPARASRAIRR